MLCKVIYSPEIISAAEQIRFSAKHFKHRIEVKGVTIDGEESPDLDDAIWVMRTHYGYQIDVHIADAAALVPVGSVLFTESIQKKETRYYAAGETHHMLPPRLSENLLSLLEGQKRLTVTIRTELNKDLDIINRRLFKSIFISSKRLSHGSAADLMRDGKTEIGEMLELAYKLSAGLIKKRFSKRRASLMDIESGFYLDKYGNIRQLRTSGNKTNLIIQALMVLSNEMVSHYFIENDLPGLFRNHLPKNKNEISEIMKKIIENNGKGPTPQWLERLERSFSKAKYEVKNKGHRSLLVDSYVHFTSPIRRVADLVNHAILHAYLNSQKIPFSKTQLRKIAKKLNP